MKSLQFYHFSCFHYIFSFFFFFSFFRFFHLSHFFIFSQASYPQTVFSGSQGVSRTTNGEVTGKEACQGTAMAPNRRPFASFLAFGGERMAPSPCWCCPVSQKDTVFSHSVSSCLCLGECVSFCWYRPVRRLGWILGFPSLPSASNSPRSITEMLMLKRRDERDGSAKSVPTPGFRNRLEPFPRKGMQRHSTKLRLRRDRIAGLQLSPFLQPATITG